jgi:hypothetical protein
MAPSRTLSVGMDVQKASRAVASVAQAHGAEVVSRGPIGTRPGDDAGHQLEGPGPPLHTGAPPDGHRHKGPAGRGRHGPGSAGLSVGHGQAHACDTASLKMAAGVQPKRSQVLTAIGSDAAPVWCHPRRREETDRSARPSHEAGTRRRQGRWEPTHGEQRDHPSFFLAPALPRDPRKKRCCGRQKVAPNP